MVSPIISPKIRERRTFPCSIYGGLPWLLLGGLWTNMGVICGPGSITI